VRYSTVSALSFAALLVACAHDAQNQRAHNETTPAERAEQRSEQAEARAEHKARAHDDEHVNVPEHRGDPNRVASAKGPVPVRAQDDERKDDKGNLTALDQGNGEVDLDLTQRIRKAVMADDALSFTAKNAKIITRDGHVTLRGTVKTGAEKDAIYKCAVETAGVGHVSNELEIDDD
jgi:hyperosmotically inducible periplasmic protein